MLYYYTSAYSSRMKSVPHARCSSAWPMADLSTSPGGKSSGWFAAGLLHCVAMDKYVYMYYYIYHPLTRYALYCYAHYNSVSPAKNSVPILGFSSSKFNMLH